MRADDAAAIVLLVMALASIFALSRLVAAAATAAFYWTAI